jgi:tetratricopeptide (TPR) repeat protein
MKRMHFLSLFIVFWSCCPNVLAAEKEEKLTPEQQEQFDLLVREAVEHYSARRYEEAIELFEQALDIQQEPELAYNIARSYERLAKPDKALEWYERFLEMPGTTGDLRTRALTNITALRREIAAMKEAEKAEQALSDTADKDVDADAASTNADSSTDSKDDGAKADGSGKRPLSPMVITGWSLAGVGAAAAIAGSVFGGLALGAKQDYDDAGRSPDRLEYRDDLERNALIFDIVFSSGMGLAVAGATLLVINAYKARSKKEIAEDAPSTKEDEAPADQAVRVVPSLAVGNDHLAGGLVIQF